MIKFASFIKDPLFHFLLTGMVLFLGHSFWTDYHKNQDRIIRVSIEEIERLSALQGAEMGRPPTKEDIQGLLAAYIREEALYREALKLGLDDQDTIIRRRLAQKMRFVIQDRNIATIPNREALFTFFEENKADYVIPKKLSFTHIYISPDASDIPANTRIDQIRAILAQAEVQRPTGLSLGDPFMLSRYYSVISEEKLAREFGAGFAKVVFEKSTPSASQGEWFGPIPSVYGLHLVQIQDIMPPKTLIFDDIRPQVEIDYLDAMRKMQNETAIQDIIGQYKVEVEGL